MRPPLFFLFLIAVLVCNGGCASLYVAYHRDEKVVSNIWPKTECKESIGVVRATGMMHFGVHGPWREEESYGIFFKRGTAYPEEFYFTVAGDSHTRIADSKGRVEVQGRHVMIEYSDPAGQWLSPPINGRHKIDSVFPDDIQPALDAAKKAVESYNAQKEKPNKALEPTPTSVTSPAAQEPRQP